MKQFLQFIASFFNTKMGKIFEVLMKNVKSNIIKEISDKNNQKKAYEFVKELNKRQDLTSKQKATEFNKKMISYLKDLGKEISTNAVNCLRELAVSAVKSELEKRKQK